MTYRPKDTQERILHRLRIAKGHLEKVIQMVEKDEYCIDIIHQSKAVQAAIKETDALILKNHLEGCVVNDIKQGKVKETIDEVLKVFEKS
ncbi:hypothetical protein A3D00_01220 [Candidatus Woesebacteria bacterium RIFCSPHIGHO2_02_FULL_38_9]|uniref:Transcriptional regulator n=1 Tax=Candidatus Woesebacteria bacterium RIFCSPHIGHO2_01_FULL_39_28 TaxID=1802496 RepID=A0A1F7YH07_9BACT|nr:MAG: hypothetical protein A2627_01175 [Candidatus Woesebacteria bacterium RIFCSPHIGHO2_01_FULL_39_28]OGM31743.1 MAG: hypothetical protein A3D00_01220 [Candidatus Woesebacteria bacterium RIFCSPHIGHO2_02_FULL_38_9]OGM57685.1 MAG: hypothetical protein A3A50_01595 [Candidatus Woesebacteria bacterium RIFCSPLOWO2_01_FULL_38_20]